MLRNITFLLAFQSLGETVARGAVIAVPGPVLGLGVSEAIGGEPTLTAVLVILTGIIGAIVATPLLSALRIEDWRARGFAVGLAARGIGTAHAFRVNCTAGALCGIGIGLNAILSAFLAPLVVTLLMLTQHGAAQGAHKEGSDATGRFGAGEGI